MWDRVVGWDSVAQVLPAPVVDYLDSLWARKVSPVFTGNPTAPTPTAGDNDTSVATTAFVNGAVAAGVAPYAPLASPALTGNPTGPTAAAGDSDTSLANTAFVQQEIAARSAASTIVKSGNQNITLASAVDVTDLTITVANPGPSAVYLVIAQWDLQNPVSSTTLIGSSCVADGVSQSTVAYSGLNVTAAMRLSHSSHWLVTGLAAGNRIIKSQAQLTAASGTFVILASSRFTVMRLS